MNKKNAGLTEKWGVEALELGWVGIPTTLLFLQKQLNISPLGLNILLNLVAHWWDSKEKPHPAQEALASRMGVSKRSVQREISALIEAGLLEKSSSPASHPKYRGRNAYDLSPLIRALRECSPHLVASMRQKKAARQLLNEGEGENL